MSGHVPGNEETAAEELFTSHLECCRKDGVPLLPTDSFCW